MLLEGRGGDALSTSGTPCQFDAFTGDRSLSKTKLCVDVSL
jgi:hypothetical protein